MLRILAKLCRRKASAFKGAQQGATAVEFALIAPAFIALLIAIFETTIFLFAQANLQAAAGEAGRLLMTGQAQNSNMSLTQFKSAVCPSLASMINCSNIVVAVQDLTTAGTSSPSAPSMFTGCTLSQGSYVAGNPGDLMVVYVGYALPTVAGPLGFFLGNSCNGTAAVWGVAAFKVEPYPT